MNFYSNFIEFCKKNNLTKSEAIEILEQKLELLQAKSGV